MSFRLARTPPSRSCLAHPQRKRSRVPKRRRFRHSAPRLSSISVLLGDDRAVFERAGSHQAADGGLIDGEAPGEIGLRFALCDPLQRLGALMGRELARPAEADAALLGALAALARPGADQVALELGQATEDGEQERQTVEVVTTRTSPVKRNQQPVQFQTARQCGSRTKSGKPCRSPATKKGRCRLHGGARGSGAPAGERNGQYRHGERTKGAIAERRKFSALLKLLRAGLT